MMLGYVHTVLRMFSFCVTNSLISVHKYTYLKWLLFFFFCFFNICRLCVYLPEGESPRSKYEAGWRDEWRVLQDVVCRSDNICPRRNCEIFLTRWLSEQFSLSCQSSTGLWRHHEAWPRLVDDFISLKKSSTDPTWRSNLETKEKSK